MKRRLRKKLRIAEFRQLGFELRFRTPADWSDDEQMQFWDRVVLEGPETRGLAFGGGCGVVWDGVVLGLADRASISDAQRESLARWLSAEAEVSDLVVGPLFDVWHARDWPLERQAAT